MTDKEKLPSQAKGGINRRRHARFAGPFDGWRLGLLETPLRIFDLSRGGCFVDSMHEQPAGSHLTMKVVLPEIGTLTLTGETLYERSGFGFAVRFVDVDAETAHLLDRALEALRSQMSPVRQPSQGLPPAVVALADTLTEPPAHHYFRKAPAPRAPRARAERPRAARVGMLGSGYRVMIDGRHVALIDLSLSGVQIRGSLHLALGHPVILKIGWPQDQLSFTAIARVRWVQPEPDPRDSELMYRIGLAFETWDVRRLREIIGTRGRSTAPTAEVVGTW